MTRKRKSKSSQQAVVAVAPASQPKTVKPVKAKKNRRRRSRRNKVPMIGDYGPGFFEVYRGIVKTTTPPGTLFQAILHPIFFQNTPYFNATVNYTHRVEHSWEWRVMVTTASFTGMRVAVIPIDDPSPTANLTSTVALQQVAAGRAAIATSTGTVDRDSSVISLGSTVRLSNATPQSRNESWMGFANGSVFVYLLDPPIGLSTSTDVQISVLARPRLTVSGPFVGFIQAESPTPPGNVVTLSITTPSSQVITTSYHYQGAELDAGYYMDWYKNGIATTDGTWAGSFTPNSVYQCDTTKTGWVNVLAATGKPVYFVPFVSGRDVLLVGFSELKSAYLFCYSPTAVVKGSEYAVSQGSGTTIKYSERFDGNVVTFVPISQLTLNELFSDIEIEENFERVTVGQTSAPRPNGSLSAEDAKCLYDEAMEIIRNANVSDIEERCDAMNSADIELLRIARQLAAGLSFEDTPASLTENPPY